MLRWSLGDWVFVLCFIAGCFALGWMEWQKPPQIIYVQTQGHEIIPYDPAGIPLHGPSQ